MNTIKITIEHLNTEGKVIETLTFNKKFKSIDKLANFWDTIYTILSNLIAL